MVTLFFSTFSPIPTNNVYPQYQLPLGFNPQTHGQPIMPNAYPPYQTSTSPHNQQTLVFNQALNAYTLVSLPMQNSAQSGLPNTFMQQVPYYIPMMGSDNTGMSGSAQSPNFNPSQVTTLPTRALQSSTTTSEPSEQTGNEEPSALAPSIKPSPTAKLSELHPSEAESSESQITLPVQVAPTTLPECSETQSPDNQSQSQPLYQATHKSSFVRTEPPLPSNSTSRANLSEIAPSESSSSQRQEPTESSHERRQVTDPVKLEKSLKLRKQGNDLLDAKNYQDAIDCYGTALGLTPNNAILLSNRSRAYLSMTPPNLIEALMDAKAATIADPKYWKGWSRLGEAWVQCKNYEFALREFNKALELCPTNEGEATKRARDKTQLLFHSQTSQAASDNIQASNIGSSTTGRQGLKSRPPQPSSSNISEPASGPSSSTQIGTAQSTTATLEQQRQVVQERNPQPLSSVPSESAIPTNSLIRQTAAMEFDIPGENPPSYTPNLTSNDPIIRNMSQQAARDQLQNLFNSLQTSNKGRLQLSPYTAPGRFDSVQATYIGLSSAEIESLRLNIKNPHVALSMIDRMFSNTLLII
jgi:tetratricopeptide (TPR) repeat protein